MNVLKVDTSSSDYDTEQEVAASCCHADHIKRGLIDSALCEEYLSLRPGPVSTGWASALGNAAGMCFMCYRYVGIYEKIIALEIKIIISDIHV